jgi:hypothetical protein
VDVVVVGGVTSLSLAALYPTPSVEAWLRRWWKCLPPPPVSPPPHYRYYYPEDCVGVDSDSKFELLESPHLDDNEMFVVLGKATVLTQEEFYNRLATDPKWRPGQTNTFFARRFYDPLTRLCRPLHGSLQHNKYRWA